MKRNACAALAVATTALCAAGCTTTTPIRASVDSLSAFRGQTLAIVTYDPHARFLQYTAGAAAFGLVGALAAINSSNNLVKQYDLVNPSLRVAEKLTPLLSEKLKPSAVNPMANAPGNRTNSMLAVLAGKNGLVFDVDGGAQSLYFPFDWTHYKVQYFATARLVDASTGKVVAQAGCNIDSDDVMSAPTYNELYADNAALLKSKLQTDADKCVEQMTKIMFGN